MKKDGNNADPGDFIKYILGIILSAYREFEERVDIFNEKLPAIELVRNAIQSKIGKFTKSDIEELVPSVKKTSIGNSLKTLVEEGFIKRHGQGKNTFYTRNE